MSIFDKILVRKPERSLFNLSHEVKLTGNMGWLYPIMCQEVLPGDTWKINSEVLCRLAPMTAPIMHRVNLKLNYFFVPFRLIWREWEDFITGGEDGTSFPIKPYFEVTSLQLNTSHFGQGSLSDYLGFPTPSLGNVPDGSAVYRYDALPFRAYSLIWNDYFRNQNLQNELVISMESGKDTTSNYLLQRRCWEKDYFTSALPFVQRGEPVKIPIDGGNVNLYGNGEVLITSDRVAPTNGTAKQMVMHSSGGDRTFVGTNGTQIPDNTNVEIRGNLNIDDVAAGMTGEITSVNGTINDLRTAYRLQRWLENNARAGSRYIEQLLSHFGVKSSDARLQRPEYLGGFSTPIVISEVLQNSGVQVDGDGNPIGTPQGNMAGKGMSVDKTHYVKRFFEEHGFVIGLLSVLPRTSYQQGMPRQFQRSSRYDYYWPEFANLGEQDVKHNEVYYDFSSPTGDTTTFGYQQRFSEYRYIPSTVHGDFRGNLRFWHLGRVFSSAPELNADFVTAQPRDDVFAVNDPEVHKLWIEIYNDVRAVRPMPKFAIPTL